jgi:hypothetical protein
VEASLEAIVPQADASGTGLKTTVAGDLRMDAPRLLRVTLHERLEYFPGDLSWGAIPEPLWADIDEGRYRSGRRFPASASAWTRCPSSASVLPG